MAAHTSPEQPQQPQQPEQDELKQCVDLARKYLNDQYPSDLDVEKLANQLKGHSKFTYVRRVLYKFRNENDLDSDVQERLREEHGLATYKDKDLPSDRRFEEALRILAGKEKQPEEPVTEEDFKHVESIETLGQLGAIYRRIWEHDLNRRNLHVSYAFYLRGYKRALQQLPEGGLADETDRGVSRLASNLAWTGGNAAFVLDLLAREEDLPAEETALLPAERLRAQADDIRRDLVKHLGEFTLNKWRRAKSEGKTDDDDLWWLLATMGETYYGVASAED